MSTTLGVRVSNEEEQIIRWFAEQERRSVSELFKLALLDRIENEYDRELYREAKEKFNNDSTIISHEDMMKEFGLS